MRYVVGSADEVRRFAPLPRTVYLVIIARSALSIRAAHQILLSVLLLRPRKIIDFCREDLRAASRLLSTGTLSS